MKLRELGNTGYKVSEISFGTIPILSGEVPVLPAYFNLSQDQAQDVLQYAYQKGCNLFDTAIVPEYGDAEIKLGNFIQTVRRENVIISDKARFFTGAEMFAAVAESCCNLQSHADIYFVHQVDYSNEDLTFGKNGAIDALCERKAEGKIRLVGVASHYFDILLRAAKDPRVDVLQGSGNIFECGMLERMKADPQFRTKGFLLNKVYAAGLLPQYFSEKQLIGGVLSAPVSSVIIGLGTRNQVDLAMPQPEYVSQTVDFDSVLLHLTKFFMPIACDRCQKCKCIQGAEIHTLFRQYNYYHMGKDYWALRKLDLSVRELAEHCHKCTTQTCMESCPRGIQIPDMIEKIAQLTAAHIRKGRI